MGDTVINLQVPAPGLHVSDSTVAVYQSTIHGADASDYAEDGAPGLLLEQASQVTLYASEVEGGRGGTEDELGGLCAGDGGPGALVRGGSALQVIGSTVTGGQPGTFIYVCRGLAGLDFETDNGTVRHLPDTPRVLSASSPLRSQAPTTLTFTGVPGDFVVLLVSRDPSAVSACPMPGNRLSGCALFRNPSGPLVVPESSRLLWMGTLPQSGVLTRDVLAPLVPLGVESYFLQGLFVPSRPEPVSRIGAVLGTPTQMHVLDPTY